MAKKIGTGVDPALSIEFFLAASTPTGRNCLLRSKESELT